MIIVITGPTCMGKSETALEVAKKLNAIVVNADAFQIYKQMNIGVAKPPKEYFDIVPHLLFSYVDCDREYSIADYQQDLRKILDSHKDKDIVLVGGSGLYIKSALYDFEFKKEENKIDLSKYELMDNHELHKELEAIDPEEANKIHENNRKRVLRAIEIYLSQGKKKSEIIDSQQHRLMYAARFYVRDMNRDELYKKIDARVDKMMSEGLLEEAKSLFEKYGKDCRALQAIGYKEFVPVLEGKSSSDDAVIQIKKNSRNYAKRQVTYIKHQLPVIYYKDTNDLLELLK